MLQSPDDAPASSLSFSPQGDLNVGGDVVGRDKITSVVGYTAEQVSALLAQISQTYQPIPFTGRCPYPGLEAFGEGDAEFFFGREVVIAGLLERLKTSRSIVIAGPSGSGKSSLVRAGLLAALRRGALPGSAHWQYARLTPGRQPLEALARAAAGLAGTLGAGDDIRQRGPAEPDVLGRWLEVGLGGEGGRRAVLVVDQLEEVFAPAARPEERAAFLHLLTAAAEAAGGRTTVVFVVRSDFIAECAAYPALNALVNQQFLQVGAMQPGELVSAIAGPALKVGLRLDPDLVAQIIHDLQDQPGSLPLMQFALRDLFEAQQTPGGVPALTRAAYISRGGLHTALERHADAAFSRLGEAEQRLARDIFAGLIQAGPGAPATRRTAAFEELTPAGGDVARVEAVIRQLADARLLTTEARTATLAHERLIDAWPWLKRLVDENRAAIELHNQISADAQEWQRRGGDPSYLYAGTRLLLARAAAADRRQRLTELTERFLAQSLQEDEQRALQQAKLRVSTHLVSPALVDYLAASELKPGGVPREVSLVIAALRGSTGLSERLGPAALMEILNRYLAVITDVLLNLGANVDTFMGDTVMGYFNAPTDQPDYVWRAVQAAVRIRDEVEALRGRGDLPLRLGVDLAVHSGPVVAGLVGTPDHLEYTLIGDAVSLAGRLANLGNPGTIIISEAVRAAVPDQIITSPLAPVLMKGRAQPLVIHELTALRV